MKRAWILLGVLIVLMFLAACGDATPEPTGCWVLEDGILVPTPCPPKVTPTTTPPPPPQASPTPTAVTIVDEGQQLFITKGCSACHGQDAQGTAIAPALPGHSAAIVKRQARAPIGLMPVFAPDKITNEELDLIAQFIHSLPGGHGHTTPADIGRDMVNHHWMALLSLEESAVPEAIHHVNHIIDLVEGEHLARMRTILQQLEAGDIHESTHGIQDMLAGTADPALSVERMHLQMALSSLRVDDAEGAMHHVSHFLETATGEEAQQAQGILDAVRQLEFQEAEHLIEELLGTGEGDPAHDEE